MATSREIEIVIKSKDLASGEIEEIISKITKVGPASENASKQVKGHSGLMRLGMFSVGESVEAVTGQFGIMGKAGRQVGNVVEGLVGGLGKFGAVLGGAGIIVGGAVMIWKHFAEAQQKQREETMKAADSMLSMVSRYDAASPAVRRLADAQYDLAEAERKLKLLALSDAILLQGIEADKAREKHEKLTAAMLSGARGEIPLSVITASLKKMGLEADVAVAKAKVLQEQWKVFSQPQGRLGENKTLEQQKKDAEAVLAVMQEMRNRSDLIGLDRDQAELARLDQKHAAEYQKLLDHHASVDQLDSAYSLMRIEREKTVAEQTMRMDEIAAQNKITILQGTGQVMGMLYDVTGRKMKAFFILQKGAAAAEAFIHYQAAAAKAAAQGGIWALPMEAYFQAMSYIVPPLIMASAFTGPGRGGGGAAATGGIPTVSTGGTEGISTGGGAVRYETNITLSTGAVLASPSELQNFVDGYLIPAVEDAASRNITGNA